MKKGGYITDVASLCFSYGHLKSGLIRRVAFGGSGLIRRMAFGGSGLIRRVAFGGSGLIRRVAFGGSGLIRRMAFGGSGLIRGGLMYKQNVNDNLSWFTKNR